MKRLNKLLEKIDKLAPNPWYVDGVKQHRPITQLGFGIGIILVLIICYFSL